MIVGQLREHLAGLPGDLEVHVDAGSGESRAASTMARYGACIVLEAELDPDESPADSQLSTAEYAEQVRRTTGGGMSRKAAPISR